MIKDQNKYYEIFYSSVSEIIGPIADKYSLKVEKERDSTFKISLDGFAILISLGFGHLPDINITIAPAKNPFTVELAEAIGIIHLKNYADQRSDKVDLRLKSPEEIPEKLKFLAKILIDYGVPFLKGDFSTWPSIVEYVNKKVKERISSL